MEKGIAVAGNMIVDRLYTIESYPKPGELASIQGEIIRSTGGCACNVGMDLAGIDESLLVTMLGVVGDDEEGRLIKDAFARFPNVNIDQIATEGRTSFTDVMYDSSTKQRTFFHYCGANAKFGRKYIDLSRLKADILHIGYILLLAELDSRDEVYGTKLASVLAEAQSRGIKTSIDLVSDANGQFQTVVPPALRYTDYCIINEWETQQTTGIQLRSENGRIENVDEALRILKESGVREWIVIHAPEVCYGYDCKADASIGMKTIDLPEGYIKGTTGAGDAFCAGVLYGAYKGESLMEAMKMGMLSAACSLSQPGATEGVSDMREMMRRFHMD